MRELERSSPSCASSGAQLTHVAVVGAGRLGTVLAAALRLGGLSVDGPLTREDAVDPSAGAVVLCVPDAALSHAAAVVPPGPLIAHCSGATGLEALGDRPAFSVHPLMTVAPGAPAEVLRGAGAAIDGSNPEALGAAETVARAAGLVPVRIAGADRAAYHAAASVASNFLVTLEAAAERLGASAGLPREHLVPLVRAAAENWATLGPQRALTGPVARGDDATVARQRAAVAQRTPELLALFDALSDATRALAGREALAC
jgi:predicted short-subunit dehydrogenase-like oxidoreductase (DUF2520 family)